MPSASAYPRAVSGLSARNVLSGFRSPTKCASEPWPGSVLGEAISAGDSKLCLEAASAGASVRGEAPGGIASGASFLVKVEAPEVTVSSGVPRRLAVESSSGAEPARWALRCVHRF